MTESLIRALVGMQEKEALQRTRHLLDAGTDPLALLAACSTAMERVGQLFEQEEYFLPHLMMAGEMLRQISAMLKPAIGQAGGGKSRGRILMGTVHGDIHDIGKNVVTFLLEANGWEVLDIGIDQPPEKFVAAIREFRPQVVGLSGLLTLAFEAMKKTVRAIEEAGLRDEVRIMVGGGQVTEQIKSYVGADAFGPDAVAGLRLVKQWMGSIGLGKI